MAGWSTGRPVFDRLPLEGYQDNEIVDAITLPYDLLLMEWKDLAQNFERDFLDPATCRVDALDWLAQLVGFTGEYWDPSWPVNIKRELIARSHQFIWPNKGAKILLQWLLQLFSIQARIYLLGQFLVGYNKVGDALGGELLRYWILMPLTYRRESPEWELVERLDRLYMPCFTDGAGASRVVYEKFYVGFSKVGDPIF